MKIPFTLTLLLLLAGISCVRPPTPYCKSFPLPSVVPVSIGETVRFDLESIFDGYNLEFKGAGQDHIQLMPKYQYKEKQFNQTYNFTVAKILDHNRFLGLITHGQTTQLAVGMNEDDVGVTITHVVQVEDIPHLHCFDVEEAHDNAASKAYAMIDCGMFENQTLKSNEFLYIDLETYHPVLGTNEHDTFVHFKEVKKRRIEQVTDPFNHVYYVFRFITEDGVDKEHANQTYVEIFMYTDSPLNIKLIEVIDHTVLRLDSFTLADYQLHLNKVYLLIKNVGLYQLRLSSSQRITIQAITEVKQNINRFRVDQLGFNDDLNVIMANDNTAYQYEWDTFTQPNLIMKYSLMPGSTVEQIFVDYNFVIVHAWATVDGQQDRRTWIFTKSTPLYTHAFGSFQSPKTGPAIIQWRGHGSTLHLFHDFAAANIKISLPYLKIAPVSASMAGKTEEYVITATSTEGESKNECKEKLTLTYIDQFNTSIFKTNLQGRSQIYVDSPDEKDIPLMYEFFGPNLQYNVSFQLNSSITPHAYVDKIHEAVFNLPPQIDPAKVIEFQMFTEVNFQEPQPNEIYALMQVNDGQSDPITHYIHCPVNIFDRDQKHHFNCKILHSNRFEMGRITWASQIYDTNNRLIALTFETQPTTIYVYYFWSISFGYYGKKTFDNFYTNRITDFVIKKGLMIVAFQIGKRLQVYKIQDLYEPTDVESKAKPIMVINHDVMKFFGIDYFAPYDLAASVYHDEVIFVFTKTGPMAININENGIPQLLFHLKISDSEYDFEVNADTFLLITRTYTNLYRLDLPLRRGAMPFLIEKIEGKYTLDEFTWMGSDGLFYFVAGDSHIVGLHQDLPSTSLFYFEESFPGIQVLDAIKIAGGKDVLFAFDGKKFKTWVISQNPYLRLDWTPKQTNFTLLIEAYNSKSKVASPYNLSFNVIESNEAEIKPTEKFNQTQILGLGHISVDTNVAKIDHNITLNDTQWFLGNILHYNISCSQCGKPDSPIKIQNKVKEVQDIVAARAVYDMQSTHDGIFAQQYDAMFKTYPHNDSIEYTFTIPTQSLGEPCTKLALPLGHDYVMSFCEHGEHVNMYMTSLESFKPFTMGPYRSGAKAVNHVKIAGEVLMIVDNDDDPYRRAGGVYLYVIDHDITKPQPISFLDYLDYADLQIEGYTGIPYIGSADIHKPLFNKQEYNIFLTEGRTGNIFAFTFEISTDKNEIIYLYKKMISLHSLIPKTIAYPEPLRIMGINIVDYTVKSSAQKYQIQYIFLLTVKNWHHLEMVITLDSENNVLFSELVRLYERVAYPAELQNYLKVKKGSLNASYFAVPYINKELQRQIMVVYELPYFNINSTAKENKNGDIPITPVLGAHLVRDPYEISFAFNNLDDHKMLFVDVDAYNITEIQLNRQLKILIEGLKPKDIQAQNITITAFNRYSEFKFQVQLIIDSNQAKEKFALGIVIAILSVIIIIGLIIVCLRQSKKPAKQAQARQTLLTEGSFNQAQGINQSVKTESLRGTVDPQEAKEANKMTLDKEENLEEEEQEEQEEQAEEEEEQEEQEKAQEKKEDEIKT